MIECWYIFSNATYNLFVKLSIKLGNRMQIYILNYYSVNDYFEETSVDGVPRFP